MSVQLDRFSIALLILRPDAPVLDDAEAARLQFAHMAHLADLHEAVSFSPTHFPRSISEVAET